MLNQHPFFGVVDDKVEELKRTLSDLVFLGGEAVEDFVSNHAEVCLDESGDLRGDFFEEK